MHVYACIYTLCTQALDPVEKKLHTDTWFYAKRCFVAMAEHIAKHLITLKDVSYEEIIAFLDSVIVSGKSIMASIGPQVS